MKKQTFKVGDTVKTYFQKKGNPKKIEVIGVIKKITPDFGGTFYIESGAIEEFPTRKVFAV